MDVSVIVPCRGRAAVLLQTLESLNGQTLQGQRFEVIVVDDGADPPIADQVHSEASRLNLAILRQPNQGAARARNQGADQAQAPILLFLDADVLAGPQLLVEHLRCHRQHTHALVSGLRRPWEPARQTLFSRILDLDTNFTPGRRCTFQEAFSTNLSIAKADFFSLGGFDETFPPGSAYEDVDFAYRAVRQGLRLICCPEAIGYHNHSLDLRQACRRAQDYQRSAPLLFRKHPELRGQIAYLRDKEPISWRSDPLSLIARKAARRLLAWRPVLWTMERIVSLLERCWPQPALLRFLYWKVLGSYQLRGFHEGLRRYGPLALPQSPNL